MVGQPKPDCLPNPKEETNHRAEKFDCLKVMLGDGKHQRLEFFNRIIRNLLAHQTTHIKLGNRSGQSFARRRRYPYDQRLGGSLHRKL